jgi:hypothetical protein
MIKAGDIVTFTRMPEWVSSMPSDSRSVIRACLGKRFRVTEIDGNGLCVLDVTELIQKEKLSLYAYLKTGFKKPKPFF